ncbi:MAG: twin-arginine translocation signal domain-containing protein [Thermoguttaceae bacterium]|nr:twin-arginine translocation signal domain-containing protein [Thermoguttaceae bacterium]MDW8079097.1 twin-arginine translocation signal domain-containing protein [Thermoguttaceae bacterium]
MLAREQTLARRDFLRASGALTLAVLTGRAAASLPSLTAIEWPFHGAVLNYRHGRQVDGGLEITVSGIAPVEYRVTVNGQEATRAGQRFFAPVVLRERVTEIVAVSEGITGRQEHRVRVVWDRHSFPRYRFAIDDNSFFLRDIAQNGYRSLFDCFYLARLRELHQKYGTKFVLNIYYTTGDDFNLSKFPDRYRSEWADNAEWLRLAFHAYADEPARPYQNASPNKLAADYDLVAEQVLRFAGEQTWTPTTIVHWGMVLPVALPVLRQRGVRVLSGYFRKIGGLWDVNYNLDPIRSEYLYRHDALMDFDVDIVFSKIDVVCNTMTPAQVVQTLAPLVEDVNTAEIMDLMTHEQYFWSFYSNYLPDHWERVEAAIRFVSERGYKPVFLHEGFLGAPE